MCPNGNSCSPSAKCSQVDSHGNEENKIKRKKQGSEASSSLTPGAGLWATAANVMNEAGNPPISATGFATQAACDAYIEDVLLPAAQGLVNQFLNQSYNASTVPAAVLHTVIKIAANGLRKIEVNKKGGLIQGSQWMVELSDATIFTPELKAEIEMFRFKTDPVFFEQPIL
jgi:hypothetical protein